MTTSDDKRVLFGLNNVYYALWDSSTSTYGTPVRIHGAVKMALSRQGNSSTFYADNSPYFAIDTNGGYTGSLEIAAAELDMLKDVLGMSVDANGMYMESTEDTQKTFALMYEVASNTRPQRFVFYNCTMSRPEMEANTQTDTTDPDTETMDITMIARSLPYGTGVTKDFIKGTLEKSDSTATKYESFFSAVLLPTPAA